MHGRAEGGFHLCEILGREICGGFRCSCCSLGFLECLPSLRHSCAGGDGTALTPLQILGLAIDAFASWHTIGKLGLDVCYQGIVCRFELGLCGV